MTVEEKLEYLTERHKAFAESLEMFAPSVHQQGENIDRILTIMEGQTTHIEALFAIVQSQTTHIEGLSKVADWHERRLTRIEERPR